MDLINAQLRLAEAYSLNLDFNESKGVISQLSI